jgi:hypothetical protein
MHPREIELARFSDEETGAEVADHLRWCARCRSDVADYRWLQGEVTATLSAAADGVPVPRSRWWAVREALSVSERRQVAGGRVSALAWCVRRSRRPAWLPHLRSRPSSRLGLVPR